MIFFEKITAYLKQQELNGFLLTGIDNFVYLTGVSLPYPKNYPDQNIAVFITKDGNAVMVIPKEWEEVAKDHGWDKEIISYPDGAPPQNYLSAITNLLERNFPEKARLGIDTYNVPVGIFHTIQSLLPKIEWLPVDDFLVNTRLIKDHTELDLLEKASRFAELGIVSAINHLEGMLEPVSFSIQETTERMRVHVGEFGGSATGHVAALQGLDTQFLFVPPHGQIREDNLLRYDLSCSYHGYWAVASRTAYTSENPPREYTKAFKDHLTLKNEAVSALMPGTRAADIFIAVVNKSRLCCIEFDQDYGVGYGVGVSEREAPFLNPADETILQAGMVVVIDIISYGPHKEIIRNCNTYVLEDNAARLLSWYRNYDELYTIYGSTAVHG